MSWRERLRVEQSTAEDQVYFELQRQGLTEYERDWVLIFDDILGVRPMRKEKVLLSIIKNNKFTLPDFCAVEKRKPTYLDGCPKPKKGFLKLHLNPKTSARDEQINNLLTVNGWPPLRIQYNARKLPVFKVKGIVEEMKEFLNRV